MMERAGSDDKVGLLRDGLEEVSPVIPVEPNIRKVIQGNQIDLLISLTSRPNL